MSAAALTDAACIFLSVLGLGCIINRTGVRQTVKICGAAVLIAFGLNMALAVFGMSLLPRLRLFSNAAGKTAFARGVIITASNPLTIIFWGGVFSAQTIENGYGRGELFLFGTGCVLSTVLFLSFVACLGTAVGTFLSDAVMSALNFCVGAAIIFFGVKLALKR